MRAGSGQPYIPRAALQGLGQDDLTDDEMDFTFGNDAGSDSIDVSSALDESGSPSSEILSETGTYDPTTGTLIQPGDTVGVAAGIAALGAGIARIFGVASNSQLNATGITSESGEESMLPMLLILGAGAGLLYLALSDQS